MPQFLLLVVIGVTILIARVGVISEQAVDKLHFRLTIILSLLIVTTWRLMQKLVVQLGTNDPTIVAGSIIVAVLLAVEFSFVCYYLLLVQCGDRMARYLITKSTPAPANQSDALGVRERRMARAHERREQRIYFLTRRFGDHVPYWQFVVSARQLALLLDSSCVAVLFAYNPELRESHAGAAIAYVHALIALIILGVSWRYHHVIRPYHYASQNYVESLLFLSAVLAVTLGMLYTAIVPVSSMAGLRGFLEVVLVSIFIGGLLAGLGVILRRAYTGKLGQTQAEEDEEIARAALLGSRSGLVDEGDGQLVRLRGPSFSLWTSLSFTPAATTPPATTVSQVRRDDDDETRSGPTKRSAWSAAARLVPSMSSPRWVQGGAAAGSTDDSGEGRECACAHLFNATAARGAGANPSPARADKMRAHERHAAAEGAGKAKSPNRAHDKGDASHVPGQAMTTHL